MIKKRNMANESDESDENEVDADDEDYQTAQQVIFDQNKNKMKSS